MVCDGGGGRVLVGSAYELLWDLLKLAVKEGELEKVSRWLSTATGLARQTAARKTTMQPPKGQNKKSKEFAVSNSARRTTKLDKMLTCGGQIDGDPCAWW
jgi:hypothetical protein